MTGESPDGDCDVIVYLPLVVADSALMSALLQQVGEQSDIEQAAARVDGASRDLPAGLDPSDCRALASFIGEEGSGPAWEAAQFARYESCFSCSALADRVQELGDDIEAGFAARVYLDRCVAD